MMRSLEGRRFRAAGRSAGAEVGADTIFEYHQDGDLVWARYAGGAIRLGHLVGLRTGDTLDFRYSQLNVAGETSTGRCHSTMEYREDGGLRLIESWEWESRKGSGSSVLDEIAAPPRTRSRLRGAAGSATPGHFRPRMQ